jgi:heat shock protein HslJ
VFDGVPDDPEVDSRDALTTPARHVKCRLDSVFTAVSPLLTISLPGRFAHPVSGGEGDPTQLNEVRPVLHSLTLAILSVATPVAPSDTPAAGADVTPAETATAFRATGNEPSWRLDIGSSEMTLLLDFGQTRLVAPTPAAKVTKTYVTRTDQGELVARVTEQLCVDSMSGMPHPQTVEVITGDRKLTGCGGEPASLLQGEHWSVMEIDGAPLAAGSKVTLAFAQDGRLSGDASCNRFTGEYSLSGEGLAIKPAATTRMACPDAVINQERSFLATLGNVHGFSFEADGSLLLRTGDGRTIAARR